MDVYTGWGSSMGTNTYALDRWITGIGSYNVTGVTAAVPSNPRATATTSSSITMTFDVNWGNEPESGTRDMACVLRNSAGTQIGVIRNGTTTGTFTGLTRYTPYYIVGYACNSVGGGYTHNTGGVLVYTKPENPTVAKPTVSDIGRLTAKITPGTVTDNGGKTITEVETYIKGGSYGNNLTSIGKGSTAKTLSTLEPNTTYQVITRATNGITEAYSAYTTFTTIGNPPAITDVYASSLSLTGAKINYTATYDHNASFKNYKVEWRYPGASSWTALSTSNNTITGTNFDSKNDNLIEYRITVTDNWNRSPTTSSLYYRVIYDYTSDITNFKYVANSDNTYTVSGSWTTRLYNKIDICLIQGWQSQKFFEVCGEVSNLSITSSGFSFNTKPYKNKRLSIMFMLYIRTKLGNSITKYIDISAQAYPNAINTINTSGNVVSRQFNTITKLDNGVTEVKRLRQHDIVKLSRTMRYLDIDSRGTFSPITVTHTGTQTLGRFTLTYSYTLNHISRTLYEFKVNSLSIKVNSGSSIRIRNNGLKFNIKTSATGTYNSSCTFIIPNMTVTTSNQSIDVSTYNTYILESDTNSTLVTGNITGSWNSEYDYQTTATATTNHSTTKTYGNSDIMNNHLVNIKVYDDSGVDRAAGKTLVLTDGSALSVYNNGNPTNGTTDSNKFVYNIDGLPMRLDLGAEYKINRIEIQRRILGNNNDYIRNYIIGRNGNKEICYIFYDSQTNNQYVEYHKTITVN